MSNKNQSQNELSIVGVGASSINYKSGKNLIKRIFIYNEISLQKVKTEIYYNKLLSPHNIARKITNIDYQPTHVDIYFEYLPNLLVNAIHDKRLNLTTIISKLETLDKQIYQITKYYYNDWKLDNLAYHNDNIVILDFGSMATTRLPKTSQLPKFLHNLPYLIKKEVILTYHQNMIDNTILTPYLEKQVLKRIKDTIEFSRRGKNIILVKKNIIKIINEFIASYILKTQSQTKLPPK